MFDTETAHVAALVNRVPTAVLVLEILGSAIALVLLAACLAIPGSGVIAVLLASALVAFLLLVTTDLDRPTRETIRVPDKVLKDQLASIDAAAGRFGSALPVGLVLSCAASPPRHTAPRHRRPRSRPAAEP